MLCTKCVFFFLPAAKPSIRIILLSKVGPEKRPIIYWTFAHEWTSGWWTGHSFIPLLTFLKQRRVFSNFDWLWYSGSPSSKTGGTGKRLRSSVRSKIWRNATMASVRSWKLFTPTPPRPPQSHSSSTQTTRGGGKSSSTDCTTGTPVFFIVQ